MSISALMHTKVLAIMLPGVHNTCNVSCVYVRCQKRVSEVGCGMNMAAGGVRNSTKLFEMIRNIATRFRTFVCVRKWS